MGVYLATQLRAGLTEQIAEVKSSDKLSCHQSSSSIGSDNNVSVQEHVPAQPSKLRNLAEIVQQQS